MLLQELRRRRCESVARPNVHTEQVALDPARHACGTTDQDVAAGCARERDHDTLARLPRASRCRGLRGTAGGSPRPCRRPTAARSRAARPGCRGGSSSRATCRCARADRCCRAPSADAAPRASCRRARPARRHATISSGIVSCCLTPVMRSTTSLTDSRCWMFTVEMTSIPASRSSLDVLPALLVPRARDVAVRELVDQHHRSGFRARTASTSISVNSATAVVDRPARYHLEVADLLLGERTTVRLDEPDDDVGAAARRGGAPR